MNEGVLVDAGPLVAILNRRDRHHRTCIEVLKQIRQPLLSTWMPVTEAMYLLDFSIAAQGALLEMIERGALQVLELVREDLAAMHELMRKYRDQQWILPTPRWCRLRTGWAWPKSSRWTGEIWGSIDSGKTEPLESC